MAALTEIKKLNNIFNVVLFSDVCKNKKLL